MDSLTQLALGAAVGEAVLGKKVGYRAALWGGICGIAPDLDVFFSFGDPVADFTYHRSFSHSLFVLAALSPVVVWLILKLHPSRAIHRTRWLWLVFLAFVTHALLDSFTVYGTQIFWPIYKTPMTWSSIFIIDPMYTLPLLVGVLCALIVNRRYPVGHRMNAVGLWLSTIYLLWSFGAKLWVEQVALASLSEHNFAYEKLLVTPAPLNTILWRGVAINNERYYEGFYSLLDNGTEINWKPYTSTTSLLNSIEAHWPVQRLRWFTKGFYKVERVNDDIVMTDLRMGVEPDYVFSFKVAEVGNPHAKPVVSKRYPPRRNWSRVPALTRRIWDESAF